MSPPNASAAPPGRCACAPAARSARSASTSTDRDPSVKPGDDFYRYAIGHWMATNQIPADRTVWGTFSELDARIREAGEGSDRGAARAGGAGQQRAEGRRLLSRLHRHRCHREGGARARTRRCSRAIDAARTHEDIATLMGRPDLPVRSPIGIGFDIDQKNPDRYIVVVTQAGLGLPERDYYLKDDATFKEIRDKYQAHIARMLDARGREGCGRAGEADPRARNPDREAMHWPIAKRRERELTYNPRTRAELDKLAPHFPWKAQLAAGRHRRAAEIRRRRARCRARSSASMFRTTPVARLAQLSQVSLPRQRGGCAAEGLRRRGLRFLRPHAQRPAAAARSLEARGRCARRRAGRGRRASSTSRKYFPPESKAKMLELVENLRKAYAQRVQQLPWMTRRHQEGRAREARHVPPEDRLSRQVAGLLDARSARGRCVRQRDARARCSTGTATRTGSASRRIATSGA